MEDVSIDHAKQHLDDLVQRARQGEDVRIATSDGGLVRLQPLRDSQQAAKRKPGRLQGVYDVPEGLFDGLPNEELRRWNGERD
jgi:prevent-host-death family protein